MLCKGHTDDINGSIDNKEKTIFCLSLHYNDDNSYLLTEKKPISLMQIIKMSNSILPKKHI